MRKCLLLAVLAALVGTNAGAAQTSRDRVLGGGISTFGDQFSVAATSGPLGEDPRGHVELRTSPTIGAARQTFHGDVREGCLVVVGNRAIAVGRLREEQQFIVPGGPDGGRIEYAAVAVEDNGEPTMGQPVDRAFPVLLFTITGERICAGLFPLSFFSFPLAHGNVIVDDATLSPGTST